MGEAGLAAGKAGTQTRMYACTITIMLRRSLVGQ